MSILVSIFLYDFFRWPVSFTGVCEKMDVLWLWQIIVLFSFKDKFIFVILNLSTIIIMLNNM